MFKEKTAAQVMFTHITIKYNRKIYLANIQDSDSQTYKVMALFCLFSFQWLHIPLESGLFF